jgi:hypothetical protein
MSEPGVWIDDESTPTDEPPRCELPRLQIIHLMMGMVATAAAFVPYRLQERVIARDQNLTVTAAESTAVALVVVAHGLSYGAVLFVGAASVVWTMRGCRFRLPPGHILALEGVARWTAAMGAWIWLYARDDALWSSRAWMWAPQAMISTAFFIGYLVLAARGRETWAWRIAYVVLAGAPLAGFLAARLTWSVILVGEIVETALQGAAIAAAMLADWRGGVPRHWSHWVACLAVTLLSVALAAYYVSWALNPPR